MKSHLTASMICYESLFCLARGLQGDKCKLRRDLKPDFVVSEEDSFDGVLMLVSMDSFADKVLRPIIDRIIRRVRCFRGGIHPLEPMNLVFCEWPKPLIDMLSFASQIHTAADPDLGASILIESDGTRIKISCHYSIEKIPQELPLAAPKMEVYA